MNKKVSSTLALTLCAIIWGTAFVAQRAGMENIGPFFYSASRMLIGAIALIPISLVSTKGQDADRRRKGLPAVSPEQREKEKKVILKGGAVCGFIIFFAANTQQVGLVSTTAGKTAFITTLYIILVPLLGLFVKQLPNLFNWIGVVFATTGLYFLCITENLTIARGDLIILIGALFWALHILFMDHYAPKVNVAKLVCVQFFVAGLMSLVVAMIIESFIWESFIVALPGILYVGVMSTAVAFTFQALGQKNANPTVASIILSTESLFGAISGYLILGEMLTSREIIGCLLMFIAVIIAQLPTKKERLAMRKEG
ncbi:MAG: DMT family transporter [Anaerovoracaceae bacterium]|jgi:drug/metabolite transporter (DMT)-like permease